MTPDARFLMRFLGPALLSCVAACARPAAKGSALNSKKAFFDRVDAYVEMKDIRPENIAKALELPLEFKKNASIDYMDMFEARPSSGSWVTYAEVRVSHDGTFKGISSFNLAPGLGIGVQDILSRYGRDVSVSPPSPHGAPGDNNPAYWSYRRPGGRLSFGVNPDSLLVTVVLNRDRD
jgi:hypothetical protein